MKPELGLIVTLQYFNLHLRRKLKSYLPNVKERLKVSLLFCFLQKLFYNRHKTKGNQRQKKKTLLWVLSQTLPAWYLLLAEWEFDGPTLIFLLYTFLFPFFSFSSQLLPLPVLLFQRRGMNTASWIPTQRGEGQHSNSLPRHLICAWQPANRMEGWRWGGVGVWGGLERVKATGWGENKRGTGVRLRRMCRWRNFEVLYTGGLIWISRLTLYYFYCPLFEYN